MGIGDWFKSDVSKYGQPVPKGQGGGSGAVQPYRPVIDDLTRRAIESLPRGVPMMRGQPNREERAQWATVDQIVAALPFAYGKVSLGHLAGHTLGHIDDRPMVTIAGPRGGKTSSILLPALYSYVGSALVLDPKGELAAKTAAYRQHRLGQKVVVLDPFNAAGVGTANFNVLDELDPSSPTITEQVAAIAQSLVDVTQSGERHWDEKAIELIGGLILFTLTLPRADRSLSTMRELLTLKHPFTRAIYDGARASSDARVREKASEEALDALFSAMAEKTNVFNGVMAATGMNFAGMNFKERESILSTARRHTVFLDSAQLAAMSGKSDFSLADLRHSATTIYLCLPAQFLETHARWLRLVVQQSLSTLERLGTWPRGQTPILFLMEEFAYLGHMPAMERAAAYFPGFGVKLWAVLQTLGQLQRHYEKGWEVFLAGAGVLQCFANTDMTTLEYISNRLGSVSFVRGASTVSQQGQHDRIKERLIYPHELAQTFARETGLQCLMIQGMPPVFAYRYFHDDVNKLEAENMALRRQSPQQLGWSMGTTGKGSLSQSYDPQR